jgi:23S rRNA (cytidine1920-2'-O)/16S rRNA (cytidine1409-2'-O)-methyltransferase
VAKRRIDSLLLERGLVESRAKAQALIMAGAVTVGGQAIIKPGIMIPEEAEVALAAPLPFVSRGGFKLEYALEQFQLDVSGKVAADIGASTGGFTDCLLKRGAKRVYAVDVGHGQLDYHLRKDPRVVVMEGVNARYPIPIAEKLDLATIDVSFISVTKVIPSVAKLLSAGGDIIVLLKPQFEAKRTEVGRGGIIKEPVVHARVLGRFIAWLSEHNFNLSGLVTSPILGASGNREFLLLSQKQRETARPR